MPRKPAAAFLTPAPVDVRQTRIRARAGLPPNVAAVFNEITASVEAAHIRASDLPVFEELARAIALQREASAALAGQPLVVAGRDGPRPHPLVKVVSEQARLIASLATRCRLTPQARMSKERANSTTDVDNEPPPWSD